MTEFETGGREFAIDFLNYYDKVGINDEFDKKTQKMIPSAGVLTLVKQAKAIFPERMPGDSGPMMKHLPSAERDEAIKADANVIDARDVFVKRMAANGGARGLLRDIASAVSHEDAEALKASLEQAIQFSKVLDNEPLS